MVHPSFHIFRVIFSTILLTLPLFAQDDSDPFHPKTTVLVTATRSEMEVDRSPLSATVITQKEMEARRMQTIDMHLTLVGGVYVKRAKGPLSIDDQVLLRGFNGDARSLVLVDGQPFNEAYASGVNWTAVPVEEVQSVEVAKGPYSSLYGGNALGGVINIRTRPIESRHFEVLGQYGTYDTTRYSARYTDRFFDRLGISIGYERFQSGGYATRIITASPAAGGTGTLVTGAIPTQTPAGAPALVIGEGGTNWLNQRAVRARGEYTFGSSTFVSLQYLRMDYAYGHTGYKSYLRDGSGNAVDNGSLLFDNSGVLQRISITPNGFLQGPGEQHANLHSASIKHQFSSSSTLNVDGGYFDIPAYRFRSLGAGNTAAAGPGTYNNGIRRNYHGNIQYSRTARGHNLTFGTEMRHDKGSNSAYGLTNWNVPASVTNQTFLASGKSINHSVYAQDQISLTERLRVILGARYDYWKGYEGRSNGFNAAAPFTLYPVRSNKKLTGKAVLGYTLPGDWNLRFSAGTAFRNPNIFEMYATSVSLAGIVSKGNPALLPEAVTSWETGVRKTLGGTHFDVAYYENHITGLIYRQTDLAADPSGRIRINANAGAGRTRGVEASVRRPLIPGMEFRAAYSYTQALITSNPGNPAIVGKRVTFIPDQTASGQLLFGRKKWTGSLNGYYTAALFGTDLNTDTTKGVSGGYDPAFVVDASATYDVSSRLQLYVTSENLTGRRTYNFYISPGRTVYGGFRVRL
jgi:iron complex outermembrane receptor protein